MKKFFQEFKDFINRGNVIDMAVGVIIGSAFGKIVTAMVDGIIMPLITLATGESDISGLSVVLNGVNKYITDENGSQVLNPEAVLLRWGNLIQVTIDFLLIALVLFTIVKIVNVIHHRLNRKKEEAEKIKKEEEAKVAAVEAAKPTPTEALLIEIRDLLKKDETK